MTIKELITQLQQLNPDNEIFIQDCLEIYKPIIQAVWDSELQENYFIITKG